jgi:aspartyl-tRNA(Asn)/glutamyl-tRNA(Gln) amidotransferase subunit A
MSDTTATGSSSGTSDGPWLDDACSLVDAFRRGDRSPVEETQASLDAIERSDLNCFSHVDAERALEAARNADISLPFGGVPYAIKELDSVAGWPDTGGSLVFKDRVAKHNSAVVDRITGKGGVVPVGLTTSSEFGGLNVSVTKLNGVTHNPWQHGRTCGGSSAGSASAVAGGLVSLAGGGDGGGSIRIPAAYCGLLGMKGTYGRISRGPHAYFRPGTVVLGNLSRSVRDAARFYDVTAGVDPRDPTTLPSDGQWEANLGTHDLRGKKVAIVPSIGGTPLDPGVEEHLRAKAEELARICGMEIVDVPLVTPNLAAMWMMGNLSTLLVELGKLWPKCAPLLTDEVAFGLYIAQAMYNLNSAGVAEGQRLELHEAMATAFEQADFIIVATNPGPAFGAELTTSNPSPLLDKILGSKPGRLGLRGATGAVGIAAGAARRLPQWLVEETGRRVPELTSMGGLTIAANVYGNPSVSIPIGTVRDLPVGMQVMAPHHHDALLFDVALAAERELPWPKVAPAVTAARAAATGTPT